MKRCYPGLGDVTKKKARPTFEVVDNEGHPQSNELGTIMTQLKGLCHTDLLLVIREAKALYSATCHQFCLGLCHLCCIIIFRDTS